MLLYIKYAILLHENKTSKQTVTQEELDNFRSYFVDLSLSFLTFNLLK